MNEHDDDDNELTATYANLLIYKLTNEQIGSRDFHMQLLQEHRLNIHSVLKQQWKTLLLIY